MWPFGKPRAQFPGGIDATDATEVALEVMQREASGQTLDSATLAVAESCISLWSRAMASATVQGDERRLAGLSAPVLALIGRALAMRGNFVALLEVRAGRVNVFPASGWDPSGGYDPASRRYRVTLPGPSDTITRDVHADSVLHITVNASDAEPWRGRSPLWRARSTAGLAATIERQLAKEAKLVPLRLMQGETYDSNRQYVRDTLKKGGILFTRVVRKDHHRDFMAQPTGSIGPDPKNAFVDLRQNAGREILSAFGLSAALFDSSSDGSARRESWRQAWIATFAPLGKLLEAEIRAKLDAGASVTFNALRASDEDGRSRAISRRATAFKTFIDAGIGRAEALRLAGLSEELE